jgi:membrane carboxypeptidase/penicillin-binding protein PbpC
MTRKINFREIAIKNVEGKEQKVDISQLLGNQLYMEGANIEECELGKRIYFAKEEVELTEAEAEILRVFTQRYSYVIRTAIADMLKSQTTD